jgi:hypothetical protein
VDKGEVALKKEGAAFARAVRVAAAVPRGKADRVPYVVEKCAGDGNVGNNGLDSDTAALFRKIVSRGARETEMLKEALLEDITGKSDGIELASLRASEEAAVTEAGRESQKERDEHEIVESFKKSMLGLKVPDHSFSKSLCFESDHVSST